MDHEFECYLDGSNLDERDANECAFYEPVSIDEIRHCATCNYFHCNWNEDTIIEMAPLTKLYGYPIQAPNIDTN
jgi:hypothetical protein